MSVTGQWLRNSVTANDIYSWLKIIGLIFVIGMIYATLRADIQDLTRATTQLGQQTGRIERYLSSKDPQYWEKAKAYEDP